MTSKEEIKQWLLENCANSAGNLDLIDLDFSDFDGDIFISGMKVKKDLHQDCQDVGGDLLQGCQIVKGNLHQRFNKVGKDLLQDYQEVEGKIEQYEQNAKEGVFNTYEEYLKSNREKLFGKEKKQMSDKEKELTALCKKQEEYIKELEEKLKTPSDTKKCVEPAKPTYEEVLIRSERYGEIRGEQEEIIQALLYSLGKLNTERLLNKEESVRYQQELAKETARADKLFEKLEER